MPNEFTISQIISFAKQSQVNTQIKISRESVFSGGTLDPLYSRKLYLIRKAVEFMNTSTPAYATLRHVAEYLYALARPYITSAATITISNPSNQSLAVGQNATFNVTVFVSNGMPYTIQWFRNGVAIPGATSINYTLNNVQLADSGAQFSATATASGVGIASSATATLTVTSAITIFAYYGDIDPFPNLSIGIDNLTYQISFNITHNIDISVPFPLAASNNKFNTIKIPVSENTKVNWFNTPLNNGTIPDGVYRSYVNIGGFNYIISRNAMSLDSTQPMIYSA